MDEVDFYLNDLKSKFIKIDPSEYYLAYSGGKDSHLIYWFLKVWLKDNDLEMYLKYKQIKIVGVNTYMEHQDILKRIQNNCDIVLKPVLKPFEIKEKYGSPCFSKPQDEKIRRFQNGLRSEFLLKCINGYTFIGKDGKEHNSTFKLNKTAKDLLLSGKLHKVSPLCCKYLKKLPMINYGKETGRKSIMGIMASEGKMRAAKYTSCFTKDGNFTPLWDLTDKLENEIYKKYKIDLPKVYDYIDRTGCMGYPMDQATVTPK